jgi:hypothetical protein
MDEVKNSAIKLILLTGCIDPGGMHFTSLQNMEVRKLQYISAIQYYLEHTDCHVLFVENSGNDISACFKDDPRLNRLEFLTFKGNDFNKALGKGYGEMLILEYATKHSMFIKNSAFMCKITGRYKIRNIRELLDFYIQEEQALMVQLSQQLNYSDSRIFFANRSFFEHVLLKYRDRVDDSQGYYFEHALSKAVLEAVTLGYSYLPFKYKVRISGQSGTDGLFYKDSFFSWYLWNLLYKLRFKLNGNR